MTCLQVPWSFWSGKIGIEICLPAPTPPLSASMGFGPPPSCCILGAALVASATFLGCTLQAD